MLSETTSINEASETIRNHLAKILKSIKEIEGRIELIEDDRDRLAEKNAVLVNLKRMEGRESRDEVLLGSLLEATKLSLKLIQANSMELVSSIERPMDYHPDLREEMYNLMEKLNLPLNIDTENRAIRIVGTNRQLSHILADAIQRFSQILIEKDEKVQYLTTELNQARTEEATRVDRTRTRMIEENETLRNRLAEESTRALNTLAAENTTLKINYEQLKEQHEVLEDTLQALLANVRIQKSPVGIHEDRGEIASLWEQGTARTIHSLHRISLAFIKMGQLGPEVMCSDKLSFIPPEHQESCHDVLIRNGAFYMTLVGQGDLYSSGLYGPLPVHEDSETLAYVYAFPAQDLDQLDPRARGESYVLACVFFPKDLNVALGSYQLINAGFQFLIPREITISDLTHDFLTKTRELLVELLVHKEDERRHDKDLLLRYEELKGSSITRMVTSYDINKICVYSWDIETRNAIFHDLVEIAWNDLAMFNARKGLISLKNGSQICGFPAKIARSHIFSRQTWKSGDINIVFVPPFTEFSRQTAKSYDALLDRFMIDSVVVWILDPTVKDPGPRRTAFKEKLTELHNVHRSWHVITPKQPIPSIKQAITKVIIAEYLGTGRSRQKEREQSDVLIQFLRDIS